MANPTRMLALLALLPAAIHATTVTLSFTVMGQPNIAVGFVDIDTATCVGTPLLIGTVTDDVAMTTKNVEVACHSGNNTLTLSYNGDVKTFAPGVYAEWSFNADSQSVVWRTQADMLDIMYDCPFDKVDALTGKYTVSANNTFLEDKFQWSQGVSTMTDVTARNKEMKTSSGRCPMLSASHQRVDDFEFPTLVSQSLNRYNWFSEYVQEKQLGKLQATKDVIDKTKNARLNFEALTEVVDGMYRDERMNYVTHENGRDDTMEQNELRRFQATCLAPFQPIFIKNGNRDMSFVRRGHYDEVAYTYELNQTDRTALVSAFDGAPKYMRALFDETLPHKSGFPKPSIQSVVDGRENLQVIAYDIAAVTYEYAMLWWTGKAITGLHADAFAGRWMKLQSVQGGSPNVNGTRMQSNYTEFKEALNEFGLHLLGHFESSPVWHFMWPQIRLGNDAASVANLMQYMPLTTAISVGNVAANSEYMLQRLRYDMDLRQKFRDNNRTFVLEFLRTRGGLRNTYIFSNKTAVMNTTYTDTKTGETYVKEVAVSNKFIQSHDSVAANLDPSHFVAPNTFNTSRTDWMNTIWGLPLWKYYADDGTDEKSMKTDGNGAFTFEPNYTKWSANNPGYSFGCPGMWLAQDVMIEVVGVFLDRIEAEEALQTSTCNDYPLLVAERFGQVPTMAPAWSTECMWALARVDLEFGPGKGCERLGQSMCCATCAELDQTSKNYVHIQRSMTLMDFKEKQFTWLTPATFAYYLYTQKFFDDKSLAIIPRVSGVTLKYVGAAAILEYYTLQVHSFNEKSFRHYKRYFEIANDEFQSQDDGLRMKHWHMDPMENNGVETDEHNVAWPDFSHFVYHNTTSFMPFKNIFHDFRPNKGILQFRPEAWALMNSFGAKYEFCSMLQSRCTGNNSQFDSLHDCLFYYADIPAHKRGYCPLFAGNTMSCRWMHSILAQDGLRPEVHCFHMGPHNADPNGKTKCVDTECGSERQGPWDCGLDGCSGRFYHAGNVVDWMHFLYWFGGLVWSAVIVYVGVRKAYKTHKSDAAHHTIKKAAAAGKVFAAVAGIQALLYLIAAAGREDTLLWRPPPAISDEPRYSEARRGESLFKDVQYVESYDGQHTENVLSNLNHYILMHLRFYLLVAGMCTTIVIIEWIGHRYLFSADRSSVLYNEIPAVGSAIFVIFVSTALVTPASSFSLLMFILGVTKLGYPDILLQSWRCWDIRVRPDDYIGDEEEEVHVSQFPIPNTPANEKSLDPSTFVKGPVHADSKGMVRADSFTMHAIDEGSDSKRDKNKPLTWAIFIVNYMAAVGLMLHHFMMCTVFAGFLSHILVFEDYIGYSFSLNTILFCVLLQHLLHQLWGSQPVLCTIMIAIVELFFQWFVISSLGEAGTTVITISVLSLALSHWLMMPKAALNGFTSKHLHREEHQKQDDEDGFNDAMDMDESMSDRPDSPRMRRSSVAPFTMARVPRLNSPSTSNNSSSFRRRRTTNQSQRKTAFADASMRNGSTRNDVPSGDRLSPPPARGVRFSPPIDYTSTSPAFEERPMASPPHVPMPAYSGSQSSQHGGRVMTSTTMV